MTNDTTILGIDELSRPITVKQMNETDGLIPRLKLISEIPSPTQRYVQDCLRLAELQAHNLEHSRKQVTDVRTALVHLLKSDINNHIQSELDSRSDSLVTMHEVRDCIYDELADHIKNNRRFRTEVSEIAASCIDTSGIKEDIQSDIERDLSDKISDAINDHDFGDILDDHTRDIDAKIVERIASEIEDDSSHPLVNAIARAIALRLSTVSK
jgi:disulfide oxidoreductase YuzD